MITFFLHARPMMNGKIVELTAYEGTHKGKQNVAMGSISFTAQQWELFRGVIIAGINHCRVPVEFLDGTRRNEKEINKVH